MIVAGLDWSMTCPAICIYDTKKELKFENCQFFFLIDKKKYEIDVRNLHGFKTPLYTSDCQRFDIISDWGVSILTKYGVKRACLEGYSMGSKGKVFEIAENIGLLKHKMHKAGIEFITPAPTSVKKQFTSKGNANKDIMYKSLYGREPGLYDVAAVLDGNASTSPVADVIDAYAMVDFLINNPDVKI